MVGHIFRRVDWEAVRVAGSLPAPAEGEHEIHHRTEVSDPNHWFLTCPRSRQFRGGNSQVAVPEGHESQGECQQSGGLRSARESRIWALRNTRARRGCGLAEGS